MIEFSQLKKSSQEITKINVKIWVSIFEYFIFKKYHLYALSPKFTLALRIIEENIEIKSRSK